MKHYRRWRGRFLKLRALTFHLVFFRFHYLHLPYVNLPSLPSDLFQTFEVPLFYSNILICCLALQTCVKHCTQDERNAVFMELRPHFIALASNTYAVHLVTKMLDHGMSHPENPTMWSLRLTYFSCPSTSSTFAFSYSYVIMFLKAVLYLFCFLFVLFFQHPKNS